MSQLFMDFGGPVRSTPLNTYISTNQIIKVITLNF
jgi:hypothetical protein